MFDIDKLNIYWGSTRDKIFQNKKEDTLDDTLLDLEKQILLHPRNAHNLLLPVTDEIFVKGAYKMLEAVGVIKRDPTEMINAVLPQTNVAKAIIFVKGKNMVGPGALTITGNAVKQVDKFGELNQYFGLRKAPVYTKLRFPGLQNNYRVDNAYTANGGLISEVLSQLLSISVDNVKNPVAELMNINMQTISVVSYLIERGVDEISIIQFLNQPIIKKYLQAQKANESLFNKEAGKELSKEELVSNVIQELDLDYATDSYYNKKLNKTIFETPRIYDSWFFQNKNFKLDKEQLLVFSYFLELVDQARAYGAFNSTQNSDTKGLKDKQSLDEVDYRLFAIRPSKDVQSLIPEDTIDSSLNNSIIAPFYKYGRLSYNVYNRFYAIEDSIVGSVLTNLKNNYSEFEKGGNKDKIRQTLENDFQLFLIHNYVLDNDFDRLMKGKDSLPNRMLELKNKLPNNLVMQAFLPMINHTKDVNTNENISGLRLFEKDLQGLDEQAMSISIEEIANQDLELYKDLVKFLMYQTGLNTSPFNFSKILPVGLESERESSPEYMYVYQDMIQAGLKGMKDNIKNLDDLKDMFRKFKLLFDLNNPRFLKESHKSGHPIKVKNYKDGLVWYKAYTGQDNKPYKLLGNSYQKRYNTSYLGNVVINVPQVTSDQFFPTETPYTEPNVNTVPATTEEVKSIPENSQELVTGFVPKNEQQSEAIRLMVDFINNGNARDFFVLEGKAGTGKTTLVQEVIRQMKGKSIIVSALSHKAKKVLSDKIKASGLNASSYSIAGLLGVKMNLENGKFEPDPFAQKPIQYADIVFVDEASMINEEMLKAIFELKSKGAKIIFLGDIGQLPPIREVASDKPSPVFNGKNKYSLTERVRQGEESPILPFADLYWNNSQSTNPIKNPAPFEERENISAAGTNLIFEKNIFDVVKDYRDHFVEAKETGNPNLIKIVTYKNDKRIALNTAVRNLLFDNPAEYELGEMIIFNNNYEADGKKIENAEEYPVIDFSKNEFSVAGQTFKGYNLISPKDDGNLIEYPVLQKSERPRFNQFVQQLFTQAKAIKGTAGYSSALSQAWGALGYFADIDYGYAITSHKSQGSTYQTTIIDEGDILSVGATSNQAKSQSIYTAITRSAKTSIIVNTANPEQATPIITTSVDPVDYTVKVGTNISEIKKNEPTIELDTLYKEILTNWNTYFPNEAFFTDEEKMQTIRLIESGELTLQCNF